MKILVTGAAGFIGSHLVDKLLDEGFTVTGIDNLSIGRMQNLEKAQTNPRFRFLRVDITQVKEFTYLDHDFDVILHLAALADIVPSIESPDSYFQVNVNGTFNVLEFSRKISIQKFIYIASSSCYGIPESYPTNETSPIKPAYPYALTKYLGECLALHWSEVYKIPTTSLRFFNIFGPRSRTSGTYGAVFGVFLAQKLAGQPFTVVGDGEQSRDFTYVADAVDAIITAMRSSEQGIFNVGSGSTNSINRLVELLQGEVVYIPKRPGEPDCTFADINKIYNKLGWRPSTSFEEGVNRVLLNIDYWKEAPLWTPETIENATKSWFKYLGHSK